MHASGYFTLKRPPPPSLSPPSVPAGLSVQLLVAPGSVRLDPVDGDDGGAARGPQLPKLSITATPEELRAAFEAAERMGKKEAATGVAKTNESIMDSEGKSGSA